MGIAWSSDDAITYYIETEWPKSEGCSVVLIRSVVKTRRKKIRTPNEYVENDPNLAGFFLDENEKSPNVQTGEDPLSTFIPPPGPPQPTLSSEQDTKSLLDNNQQLSPEEYKQLLMINKPNSEKKVTDDKASGEPFNIESGENNKITEDEINQEIEDNERYETDDIRDPSEELENIHETIPEADKGLDDPE